MVTRGDDPLAQRLDAAAVGREDGVAHLQVGGMHLTGEPLPLSERALNTLAADALPLGDDIGAIAAARGAPAAAQQADHAVGLPLDDIPGGKRRCVQIGQQAHEVIQLRPQGARIDRAAQRPRGEPAGGFGDGALRLTQQRSIGQTLGQQRPGREMGRRAEQQHRGASGPTCGLPEKMEKITVGQRRALADQHRENVARPARHIPSKFTRRAAVGAVTHGCARAGSPSRGDARRDRLRRIEKTGRPRRHGRGTSAPMPEVASWCEIISPRPDGMTKRISVTAAKSVLDSLHVIARGHSPEAISARRCGIASGYRRLPRPAYDMSLRGRAPARLRGTKQSNLRLTTARLLRAIADSHPRNDDHCVGAEQEPLRQVWPPVAGAPQQNHKENVTGRIGPHRPGSPRPLAGGTPRTAPGSGCGLAISSSGFNWGQRSGFGVHR